MRAPIVLLAALLFYAPPVQAQLPDLAITAVWKQVPDSHKVTFEIVVANLGEVAALPSETAIGLFNVLVFANSDSQPSVDVGSTPDIETTLPLEIIEPGEQVELTLKYDFKTPGTYHAWLMVDSVSFSEDPLLSSLALDEVTKINNVTDLTVEVTEPKTELPDLTIGWINAQVDGNKVTFAGQVINNGDDAAGPFDITFFRHSDTEPKKADLPSELISIEALEAGGTLPFEAVWEPAPNGSYLPWLCVDHQKDQVIEHEETNNCLIGTGYSVLLEGDFPDLTVTSLTWESDGPDIVYTVTIANEGTGFAGEFSVDGFFSSEDAPSCTNEPPPGYATKLVPGLAAGDKVVVQLEWKGPPVGQHSAWVLLDCANKLSELNEVNNVAGPILVNVTEADLTILKVTAEAVCTDVTWAVSIKNAGHFPAGGFTVGFFKNRPVNPGLEGFADFLVPVPGGLAPGEDITIIYDQWQEVPDGVYDTWVVVNGDKTVEEGNYANNIDSVFGVTVDSSTCSAPPTPDEDPPPPDSGATAEPAPPAPDAGSGGSSDRDTDSGGCSQTGHTGPVPWAAALLLLLVLLSLRRSADARSPRRIGSSARAPAARAPRSGR